MNIIVANRLSELRKRSGYSQEQLAEQLGISRQAVSKWERAESSPDTDNLIALAKLYGVSLDALLQMDAESAEDEAYAAAAARRAEAAPETVTDQEEADQEEEEPVAARYNYYVFPYPILMVGLYLLLGFFLNMWHPTWLIFLTIPMYYTAIDKDHFDLNRIPYPLLVVPIYLILGFAWGAWHPSWLIFLTIPIYYTTLYKRSTNGVYLLLVGLMVLGLFALLGLAVSSWGRWLMMGTGVALVAVGALLAARDI